MNSHSRTTTTTESFADSPLSRAGRLLAPRTAARLIARLRRFVLDCELADGADPAASELIAARAAQLSADGTRAAIAVGLERIAHPEGYSRRRVHPAVAAISTNRSEILDLAQTVRAGGALYAQGLAMLELLLIDGTGPAYTDRHGEALARSLALARARLSG